MASTKKKKKRKIITAEQVLPTTSEHDRQVRDLGFRIIATIDETGYHPTVALDALQVLLAEGIGILLGKDHQELWESYVHRYHEESRLVSIMELFNELKATEKAEPPKQDE